MSSLDFTYDHLDEVVPRDYFAAPEIDPRKTALLALDIQRLIVTPGGSAYVESVAGAPAGKDVIAPCNEVIERCRKVGIPVIWSLWGLRGDGMDGHSCFKMAGTESWRAGFAGQLGAPRIRARRCCKTTEKRNPDL